MSATAPAANNRAVAVSPRPGPTATSTAAPSVSEAICVDGGRSGQPFDSIRCVETVASLSDAVSDVQPGGLIVVRAFLSSDPLSIRGTGTYRDPGLQNKSVVASAANPIVIQAEGFNSDGNFVKPIIEGGIRITGTWQPTPGTTATWQVPFAYQPGGFLHWACVDRIWASQQTGKTELADFPLTRPLPRQGNDNPETDCLQNTIAGRPITPADVDTFPGSYEWLNGYLYVHLPGHEDPNRYTIEVPYNHPFSAYASAAGLIVRGFRVYHTLNGIDLFHCGMSITSRCEASYNEVSYNFPFGLQPGLYSYLHHNIGELNTVEFIKITSDFAEIADNVAGPQLSHGFKLLGVNGCLVHNNKIYGNHFSRPGPIPQPQWLAIGTRDDKAGILIQNDTHGCQISDNYLYGNTTGILVRDANDQNSLQHNVIIANEVAIWWLSNTWQHNASDNEIFDPEAVFRWGNSRGGLNAYRLGSGLDINSQFAETSLDLSQP